MSFSSFYKYYWGTSQKLYYPNVILLFVLKWYFTSMKRTYDLPLNLFFSKLFILRNFSICVSQNKSFLYIQNWIKCVISRTYYTNSVYTYTCIYIDICLYRRTALNAALRLSSKYCGRAWTCRNLITVLCVVSMTNYTLVPSSGC